MFLYGNHLPWPGTALAFHQATWAKSNSRLLLDEPQAEAGEEGRGRDQDRLTASATASLSSSYLAVHSENAAV